MDQQKTVNWALSLILKGIIGLFTTLIGIWVPASWMDAHAMADNPAGGPGATLVAMLICTPVALLVGPIAGILGGRMVRNFEKNLYGRDYRKGSSYEYVGAGVAGFVVGIIPFAVIAVSDWSGSAGF